MTHCRRRRSFAYLLLSDGGTQVSARRSQDFCGLNQTSLTDNMYPARPEYVSNTPLPDVEPSIPTFVHLTQRGEPGSISMKNEG